MTCSGCSRNSRALRPSNSSRPICGRGPPPWPAASRALQADGARTIVVLNFNEYARLVDANGNLSRCGCHGSLPRRRPTERRSGPAWRAAGVNFVPADISSLFTYVAQNPTKFGFHRRQRAGVQSGMRDNQQPRVQPSHTRRANAEQTHLWADGVHLTTAGQTIEADYIYSLLTAPSQISLLAEGAVQVGLARATTIQQQIDLSSEHRGPNGINSLGQRRGQRPDRQERAQLSQCFRHAVRWHGGRRLSVARRGHRRRGVHGGRHGAAVLHRRQLHAGG